MVSHILVASYTNDIVTLTFDSLNSTLEKTCSLTVGTHPSWITSHPSQPQVVWTGLEQANGKILALSHDSDGKLSLLSKTSSLGDDPCSLLVTTEEILVANVRCIQ